ncbi:YgiT-type zinc finger protein [Candidatus Binatia bacterium]|nr:YgiT-type zinc finger protein [Candidatus Binatia bacterium]
MRVCISCKQDGLIQRRQISFTAEIRGTTVVIRGVPALVCANCGEEYLEEAEAARVREIAEAAAQTGTQVTISEYMAAA